MSIDACNGLKRQAIEPVENSDPQEVRSIFSATTEILDAELWPEHLALTAEAATGTLVVFDGYARRFSGLDNSDTSRHACTLHVIDQSCHCPADNWLQRNPDLPLRGFF